MAGFWGRILLVGSALSPILGGYAISVIAKSKTWCEGFSHPSFWMYSVGALLGVILAYWFLRWWCPKHLTPAWVDTKQLKSTDKDVLAFLLAYMLPLLGEDALMFKQPMVAIYVFILIFLAVYHSNSYHFNPLLSLLGYHFYEIETTTGRTALLITPASHEVSEKRLVCVKLTEFLHLELVDR